MRTVFLAPAVLGSLLLSAGCGNHTSIGHQPIPPVAVITSNVVGPAAPAAGTGGTAVTLDLDGAKSYDPDSLDPQAIYQYEWTVVSMPAGADPARVNVGGNVTGHLTPDVAGDYIVQLRVQDIDDALWSAPVTAKATAFPLTGVTAVLTWDTNQSDIDLHAINAGGAIFTIPGDCYFFNMQPAWYGATNQPAGPVGNPVHSHDLTNGYGPESVVLAQPVLGESVHYMVHYFSDNGNAGATNADVKIYVNGVQQLEVTQSLTPNQLLDVAYANWTGVTATLTAVDAVSTY